MRTGIVRVDTGMVMLDGQLRRTNRKNMGREGTQSMSKRVKPTSGKQYYCELHHDLDGLRTTQT